jgi:PAS domain S-box-containing protein
MSSTTPSPASVFDVVGSLGTPGTPVTTTEVAAEFDCTSRTIYNKLDALVEAGRLETKKVGAKGRVWWRSESERDAPTRTAHGLEAQYRTLFESIDEGVCIFELLFEDGSDAVPTDCRVIEANPAFEQITGLEDVRGKKISDFDVDLEAHWYETYGRVAATGDAIRFEESLTDLNQWFDVYAFRYGAPGEQTVAAIFDDVTDRKEAEASLRAANLELTRQSRMFDTTLSSLSDFVYTIDRDGKFVYVNQAVLDFWRREFDAVVGKTFSELPYPPELAAIQEAQLQYVIETGEDVTDVQEYTTPDGERRYYEYVVSPVFDKNGTVELVAGSTRDITAHKRRQEALSEQAKLDALRVTLADELREIGDPVRIQEVASRLVGERLGVDVAYYYEYDPEAGYGQIHRNYARDGETSVAGEYTLDEFPTVHEMASSGAVVAIGDTKTDTRLTDAERDRLASGDHRAFASVPLLRDGELIAMCTISHARPHEWTSLEIAMLEATAERTWAAVERARAESALQESEERYRTLFESIDEGFCVIEKVAADPVDFRFVDANSALATQSGVTDVNGKTIREVAPEDGHEWCATYDSVLDSGKGVRFERAFPQQDRILELYAFPFDVNSNQQVGVLFKDITEQKDQLCELEEAKQQLQTATSAGAVGIWTWDVQADRITTDEFGARAFGIDPDAAAAGIPLGDYLELVPEADREQIQEQVDTGLEERGEFDIEFRVGTASSEERWVQARGEVTYDEDGEPVRVHGALSEITERKRRERNTAFLDEIGEALTHQTSPSEIMAVVGEKLGAYLDVQYCQFAGIDEAADEVTDCYQWSDAQSPRLPERVRLSRFVTEEFQRRARNGETLCSTDTHDDTLTDADATDTIDVRSFVTVPFCRQGEWKYLLTIEDSRPREWRPDQIELVGEVANRVFPRLERAKAERALRESEERLRRANTSLKRLNAVTRELIDADTETISDRVAALTCDVLGIDHAVLWRYDDRTGELRAHCRHGEGALGDDPTGETADCSTDVWQTFIGNEIDVEHDVDDDTGTQQRRVYIPLGRHGVICAGTTRPVAFDDRTLDLVETFGATIQAAWDRADGERTLAAQNEELERLDRLNRLLREIDTGLVEAGSVDDIHETVCERLASSDRFEFAWIGEYDAASGGVRPQEWAGVEATYLTDVTRASGPDPIATAIETGELQVVSDVATDPRAASWREETLERGGRSCICIPLVYESSVYGVLTVYSGRPHDDERDTAVLAELGGTIAHAINAVETKATLQTESIVELTLRSQAADAPLCRLSRDTGAVIHLEGTVPGANGTATGFFTTERIDTDDLLEAGRQVYGIDELTCLVDRECQPLFKAKLSEPLFSGNVAKHDAVVRSLTIDAGTVTAVVDLPQAAAVREFVEEVRRTEPDLELLARRPHARHFETAHTLERAVADRLTARQQEVIQLAYRSGFFESPRVQTGRDLAAALDISQSTFTYHLRSAERKLCELVFDAA